MNESATAAEPRPIVIERRWAIIGGVAVAALILILSVALAFTLGDSNDGGPYGPHGAQFSEGGLAPGMPEGGTQQMPPGLPPSSAPMPQAPDGSAPPSGDYGQPVPAPPRAGQAPQSGGQGSGGR